MTTQSSERLEASTRERQLRYRQTQTSQETIQQQFQTVAQAIQRETLEKLTMLESQQQDQLSIIRRQIKELSENDNSKTSTSASECFREISLLRTEKKELRELLGRCVHFV